MASHYTFRVNRTQKQPKEALLILRNLAKFNREKVGKARVRNIALTVWNGKSLIGGIHAYTSWNWLFVQLLWVREIDRKTGLGGQLLSRIEKEAVKMGCEHAYLDTFSFQALGFYKKNGYRVFGKLEDFPEGHTRYFLVKNKISSYRRIA